MQRACASALTRPKIYRINVPVRNPTFENSDQSTVINFAWTVLRLFDVLLKCRSFTDKNRKSVKYVYLVEY